jgi:hypothetical protein
LLKRVMRSLHPSSPVRLGYDGVVGDVDLLVEPSAVVTVMVFPIDVAHRSAVDIGAGTLAGSELAELDFQRRIGIAAVVAGMHR